MKTWDQLSDKQRGLALHATRDVLLSQIVEGVVELDMPNNILQRDFDRILSDARKSEIRVELAKELLLKHVAIGRELVKLIVVIAEGSEYDSNGFILMESNTKELS